MSGFRPGAREAPSFSEVRVTLQINPSQARTVSEVGRTWMSGVVPGVVRPSTLLLGVFPGEGSGPELIEAALGVLDAVEKHAGLRIARRVGCEIGLRAPGSQDGCIMPNAVEFCRQIFSEGGAILSGPAGGRFVYDIRREFDLFCKLAPLQPNRHLASACKLKGEVVNDVDILVVRDNAGGIYQGEWTEREEEGVGRVAEQRFGYTEAQVDRIVAAGARLAVSRRSILHVILKDGGVPTISNLWRSCAQRIARQHDVTLHCMNADYAAYRLIQHPQEFDVLVTPNMVGDILADLGAVLLGSRGLSYSSNVSPEGFAVYQTGHGAAYDLKGTNRANPVAQILSLAMLLRESFGLAREARWIENAITATWRSGFRTEDLAEPGCRVVGTRELAERIASAIPAASEASVTA